MAKDAFRNELLKALVYGVLVKTVWSWRKAPAGSFQKMVWNVALMAGIALGIWIAFRLIDARLNKSEKKLPDYREIKSESAVE
jgi:hypothetical protein